MHLSPCYPQAGATELETKLCTEESKPPAAARAEQPRSSAQDPAALVTQRRPTGQFC